MAPWADVNFPNSSALCRLLGNPSRASFMFQDEQPVARMMSLFGAGQDRHPPADPFITHPNRSKTRSLACCLSELSHRIERKVKCSTWVVPPRSQSQVSIMITRIYKWIFHFYLCKLNLMSYLLRPLDNVQTICGDLKSFIFGQASHPAWPQLSAQPQRVPRPFTGKIHRTPKSLCCASHSPSSWPIRAESDLRKRRRPRSAEQRPSSTARTSTTPRSRQYFECCQTASRSRFRAGASSPISRIAILIAGTSQTMNATSSTASCTSSSRRLATSWARSTQPQLCPTVKACNCIR